MKVMKAWVSYARKEKASRSKLEQFDGYFQKTSTKTAGDNWTDIEGGVNPAEASDHSTVNEEKTDSSDAASVSSSEVDEPAVETKSRELAIGSRNSSSRDLLATGASTRELPIGQASPNLPEEEEVEQLLDPRIAKILEDHKTPPQIFQSSWSSAEVFDSSRSLRANILDSLGQ